MVTRGCKSFALVTGARPVLVAVTTDHLIPATEGAYVVESSYRGHAAASGHQRFGAG